jgi:hypothetical protein
MSNSFDSRWTVTSARLGAMAWVAIALLLFTHWFVWLSLLSWVIEKPHRAPKVRPAVGELCRGTAYFSDARRAS